MVGKKIQPINVQAENIVKKYHLHINVERFWMQMSILDKQVQALKITDAILVMPHKIVPLSEQLQRHNIKPRNPQGLEERIELLTTTEQSNEPYVIGGLGVITNPKQGSDDKLSEILEKHKKFNFLSISEIIGWIANFGFVRNHEILLPINLPTGNRKQKKMVEDVIFWEGGDILNVDLIGKFIRKRNSCTCKIPFFKNRIVVN